MRINTHISMSVTQIDLRDKMLRAEMQECNRFQVRRK
jgi:hypothetical protein